MTLLRPLICALALAALPAWAAPVAYSLQPDKSTVGFETDFGQDHISGQMPITHAELTIDFKAVNQSTIAVTLDASGAKANFPFAAEAMKAASVLDTAAYPNITFQSTLVRKTENGARVEGNLTLRGVTQKVVLMAVISRQKGTDASDLRHLSIRLTGALKRSAFGANGWNDMVADEVRLYILARIAQVN